ncbi:hypothetical protein [Enterococcus sp. AZ196]|uniref:hypothetical protein n=1 Tax=Enterococcus sp. AZ196 TaxID=2774659 RepID=UPI003D2E4CB4
MSIGMYLVSNHKLKISSHIVSSEFMSLNDLRRQENFASILTDLKKNFAIDPKNVDPEEKIFLLPDDSEEIFTVTKDQDEGVIHKYTTKPFVYYIDIYSWKNFYEYFSDYLKSLNSPFELWKIWEDSYEYEDLITTKIESLDTQTLEKIFGLNEYLDPIVGIYE